MWATNADRKGYSLSEIKQMEELQRVPAPLASIIHDFEASTRGRGAPLRRTG